MASDHGDIPLYHNQRSTDNNIYHTFQIFVTDLLVLTQNIFLLLRHSRKFLKFRWANALRDHSFQGRRIRNFFFPVYSRATVKYKYHPLQRWENAVRRFNVNEPLMREMEEDGNKAFYERVCQRPGNVEFPSFKADFSQISSYSTVHKSGEFVYEEAIRSGKTKENARLAKDSYVNGFSRAIDVHDSKDWEMFREELKSGGKHKGWDKDTAHYEDVLPIALSYKGKEKRTIRNLTLEEGIGKMKAENKSKEGGLYEETENLSSDFVDDFRWPQLIRSCMEIANEKRATRVCIWIDRLVTYNYNAEEKDLYKGLEWTDYGLFAYAVCPVVRLYAASEPVYNTEFWRKLETILSVAGMGLYFDDYMLLHRDRDIHYPPEMYKRMNNGIAKLGGSGKYIRSVTLALATAIFTDGLSVAGANEDKRTRAAMVGYKAWALRTISEGAYSSEHCAMMQKDDKINIDFERFMTIAFWEAYVSNSSCMLSDCNYLDMSIQQSKRWKKTGQRWDGIVEWLGMANCFDINESTRSEINKFITRHLTNSTWTSTSGHVASLLQLSCADRRNDRVNLGSKSLKRSIAVRLSRFSSGNSGHVTAVAEATGLWRNQDAIQPKKILPWYLNHVARPEVDQSAEITEVSVDYVYKPMEVRFLVSGVYWMYLLVLTAIYILALIFTSIFVSTSFRSREFTHRGITVAFLCLLLAGALVHILVSIYRFLSDHWPWFDYQNVGEAVFDNLIMHGIFDSLINKKKYKALEVVPYDKLNWH